MSSSHEDRLAFMRSLGISQEDIMDPSTVLAGKVNTDRSIKSPFSNGTAERLSLDSDMYKTRKAVVHESSPSVFKSDTPTKNIAVRHQENERSAFNKMIPENLKDRGNSAFDEGRYRDALLCYTEAIEYLQSCAYSLPGMDQIKPCNNHGMIPVPDSGDSKLTLLAALFSNRSACFLQAAKQIGTEEAYENAIRDADRAVALRPSWFKGYSRQGDVYFKMKKYGQAVEAYGMALQLDPGNNNILYSLREARQRSRAKVKEEVRLSRNPMLSSSTPVQAAATPLQPKVALESKAHTSDVTIGKRESSQSRLTVRQRWSEFKHEVEANVNQPTGDNYRLEQLRLFREQKEREKREATTHKEKEQHNREPISQNCVNEVQSGIMDSAMKSSSRRERLGAIPAEFSSDAAAAYQQRLLEEFRRKKAQRA
ncbi:hypothetical protein TRVL_04529 [Trypanosoma vivax]|nr:hypothetical protein TRVL_04529 [Trypanosoma vivax]